MKLLLALSAAAIVATSAAAPAVAREGCGPGAHQAMNGMCRANRGTEARWLEGHYYPGRGYWYQNQWYPHRYRDHGYWRYR